jgi:hypothetical protein
MRRGGNGAGVDPLRKSRRRSSPAQANVAPSEILESSGFIGSADGPSSLSTNYKSELTRSLTQKLERLD